MLAHAQSHRSGSCWVCLACAEALCSFVCSDLFASVKRFSHQGCFLIIHVRGGRQNGLCELFCRQQTYRSIGGVRDRLYKHDSWSLYTGDEKGTLHLKAG